MKNLPRYTVRKNLVLNGFGDLRPVNSDTDLEPYMKEFMLHNDVVPFVTTVGVVKTDYLQSLLDELLMYKVMYGEIPQETKEAFYAKLPK